MEKKDLAGYETTESLRKRHQQTLDTLAQHAVECALADTNLQTRPFASETIESD